jgi:SAM-dependent methyltransferase
VVDRDGLGDRGFADGDAYDAARPDYPADALGWIVETLPLGATSRVLDLGAGSGIFTRQIRPRVGSVVAIEPSAGMREALARRAGDVEVLDGRDVDIPLPDGSVDAVTAAQAFHWFDHPRALEEIHRVLVPGGGLALIWNERDEGVEWVQRLGEAMHWNVAAPYRVGTDWREVVARGPFADCRRREFAHHQRLTHDGIVSRVLTTSYVTLMDEASRAAVIARVREVIAELPDPLDLPYVTDVYVARAS